MATLDFTRHLWSSGKFDRVPSPLRRPVQRDSGSFPPYTIETCSDGRYRIVMAVAGFGIHDIEVVFELCRLTVRGALKNENAGLDRGVVAQGFERQFELADSVEVIGAMMGDGVLIIELRRGPPEALEPRRIEIRAGMFIHLEHMKLKKGGDTGRCLRDPGNGLPP